MGAAVFLPPIRGDQGGRQSPLYTFPGRYAFPPPDPVATQTWELNVHSQTRKILVSTMPGQGRAKTKSVEPARKSSVSGQSWGRRPATADPQPDGVAIYWRPATE